MRRGSQPDLVAEITQEALTRLMQVDPASLVGDPRAWLFEPLAIWPWISSIQVMREFQSSIGVSYTICLLNLKETTAQTLI